LYHYPNSKFKKVSRDEKNPGKGLPNNFKKLCEVLKNEKSQKISSNGTVGN
jgi:hypothetical protein